MQAVARVLQHLGHTPTVKSLQVLPKQRAYARCGRPLFTRQKRVVLVDVVVLQPLERRHRIIQAGGGHAPGTNRGAHQIHRLARLRQPVTKNELVQRPQNQAFRATGGGRHGTHVAALKAVARQIRQRLGAGANALCFHGR